MCPIKKFNCIYLTYLTTSALNMLIVNYVDLRYVDVKVDIYAFVLHFSSVTRFFSIDQNKL